MNKKYLYIKLVETTEVNKYYENLINTLNEGTTPVAEINKERYLKEDLFINELILLDGVYYSIIDSINRVYSVIKVDAEKYNELEKFPELEAAFNEIKQVKKDKEEIIAAKIKEAEELLEQAEKLSDKFDLEFNWVNKYGVYSNGEWNSSSLSC